MITCCVARKCLICISTRVYSIKYDLKGEINESYKQMNVYAKEYNCNNGLYNCTDHYRS